MKNVIRQGKSGIRIVMRVPEDSLRPNETYVPKKHTIHDSDGNPMYLPTFGMTEAGYEDAKVYQEAYCDG